ncbi:MAG: hypothetical protein JWM28_4172 [Chitinophagaceae bacterium]|nr:hypothetical protein [Chitinophagaceae bacterium]
MGKGFKILLTGPMIVLLSAIVSNITAQSITLQQVSIFQDKTSLANGETAAAEMLSSEVEKRTGLRWPVSATWPATGDVILLKRASTKIKLPFSLPVSPLLAAKKK